jgi:N6-L-threonylcarbamoyladenine synthase
MAVNILALESSCDETSASVIQDGKVLSNTILSQSIHEIYGGVVPELASRAHQQHIISVVRQALKDSNVSKNDLSAVAFTSGPGLLGSLLVGTSFAKGLSIAKNIPLISVNHMQAHILAHFIEDPKPDFTFLCLTISGGHTQLVLVEDYLDMKIIGETHDDAVGEAFDKIAKMLGFPYPGGLLIDRHAKLGDPLKFKFPAAVMPGYDYSFSGIKTAVLYFLRDQLKKDKSFIENNLNDLCASIQHTLVEMLFDKLALSAMKENVSEIAIAGGVAANSHIRKRMKELADQHNWNIYIPRLEYCTDNAAMIGMAGYLKFQSGDVSDLTVSPDARIKF